MNPACARWRRRAHNLGIPTYTTLAIFFYVSLSTHCGTSEFGPRTSYHQRKHLLTSRIISSDPKRQNCESRSTQNGPEQPQDKISKKCPTQNPCFQDLRTRSRKPQGTIPEEVRDREAGRHSCNHSGGWCLFCLFVYARFERLTKAKRSPDGNAKMRAGPRLNPPSGGACTAGP
jgi:hypothetical protein